MNLQIRRGLVLTGVALSLAVGLASIRVAAALTADAAPPPAPPVSMASLQAQLTAEQAGSVALQQQLDEVDSLTAQLSDAIGVTSSDVSTDGLNARQLRARLVAAQKKLATASRLLEQARAKLAAVNSATPPATPVAAPVAPVEAPGAAPTPEAPVEAPVAAPTPEAPQRTPEPKKTPERDD
jgi:hypothetical protein